MAKLAQVRISDRALWRMMLAPGMRGRTRVRLSWEEWMPYGGEGQSGSYRLHEIRDARDIVVHGTFYDPATRQVVYTIEHPEFQEVEEGCAPPIVRMLCDFNSDEMPVERTFGAFLRGGGRVEEPEAAALSLPDVEAPRTRHMRMITLDNGEEQAQ